MTKWPGPLKLIWWGGLSLALAYYLLSLRFEAIKAGSHTALDIAAFLVLTCLLLAPLFSEITIFGLTVKQAVDELKNEVKKEIAGVRTDITNALEVRNVFSPQITMPAPPPDNFLPQLEAKILKAVSDATSANALPISGPARAATAIPADTSYLFGIRYEIETELRRIALSRQLLDSAERPVAGPGLTRTLEGAGLVTPEFAQAVREIYGICSRAIHGAPFTPAQVMLVRDVSGNLLRALRAIV